MQKLSFFLQVAFRLLFLKVSNEHGSTSSIWYKHTISLPSFQAQINIHRLIRFPCHYSLFLHNPTTKILRSLFFSVLELFLCHNLSIAYHYSLHLFLKNFLQFLKTLSQGIRWRRCCYMGRMTQERQS